MLAEMNAPIAAAQAKVAEQAAKQSQAAAETAMREAERAQRDAARMQQQVARATKSVTWLPSGHRLERARPSESEDANESGCLGRTHRLTEHESADGRCQTAGRLLPDAGFRQALSMPEPGGDAVGQWSGDNSVKISRQQFFNP